MKNYLYAFSFSCCLWMTSCVTRTQYANQYTEEDIAQAFENIERLVQKNDYEDAIDILLPIVQTQPNNAVLLNEIGNLFCLTGQWQDAIVAYQRAIEISPRMPEGHYNLGRVYMRANMLGQAEQHFRLAHQYAPEDIQYITAIASALWQQNHQHTDLPPLLEKIATEHPENDWREWAAELMLH